MKIWPTDSLKTQAGKIRKVAKEKGLPIPSNDEILKMFINEGKIAAAEKPTSTKKKKTEMDRVIGPGIQFATIDEDTYKKYLLLCMNGKGDIRVCTEVRNYLEKTKALTQAATYQPRPSEEDAFEFAE